MLRKVLFQKVKRISLGGVCRVVGEFVGCGAVASVAVHLKQRAGMRIQRDAAEQIAVFKAHENLLGGFLRCAQQPLTVLGVAELRPVGQLRRNLFALRSISKPFQRIVLYDAQLRHVPRHGVQLLLRQGVLQLFGARDFRLSQSLPSGVCFRLCGRIHRVPFAAAAGVQVVHLSGNRQQCPAPGVLRNIAQLRPVFAVRHVLERQADDALQLLVRLLFIDDDGFRTICSGQPQPVVASPEGAHRHCLRVDLQRTANIRPPPVPEKRSSQVNTLAGIQIQALFGELNPAVLVFAQRVFQERLRSIAETFRIIGNPGREIGLIFP